MPSYPLIGIYGGTFDPVHRGHVLSADELCQRLALEELRLMPCSQPPHRQQPLASSEQRLAMVKLAIAAHPALSVDDRELKRQGPSYTVDTLTSLRAELGSQVALCWIMGSDAFAGIDRWQRWQELLLLAHIVVMSRPDAPVPENSRAQQLLDEHGTDDAAALHQSIAGKVLQLSLSQHAVSATAIRQALASQQPVIDGLAPAVLDYIKLNQLYC
jgi:nicotinate-nucleotide adenylyltransferase